MGTVFTFVAAADLVAAAPDLVAGMTPAFNGFSAAGFLATLLASEIAGFFELGIRPRYGKNGQAEITGALPTRAAPPQPAHRHGQITIGNEEINSSADKMSGEHLVCSPCGY
ncbi:hypothetical protein [Variovorax boronicumulans]|uniref:hypothetical protein n=1 Tax=Variovorax boronicumulans TaxID=436515 RepID=UPI00339592DE